MNRVCSTTSCLHTLCLRNCWQWSSTFAVLSVLRGSLRQLLFIMVNFQTAHFPLSFFSNLRYSLPPLKWTCCNQDQTEDGVPLFYILYEIFYISWWFICKEFILNFDQVALLGPILTADSLTAGFRLRLRLTACVPCLCLSRFFAHSCPSINITTEICVCPLEVYIHCYPIFAVRETEIKNMWVIFLRSHRSNKKSVSCLGPLFFFCARVYTQSQLCTHECQSSHCW